MAMIKILSQCQRGVFFMNRLSKRINTFKYISHLNDIYDNNEHIILLLLYIITLLF